MENEEKKLGLGIYFDPNASSDADDEQSIGSIFESYLSPIDDLYNEYELGEILEQLSPKTVAVVIDEAPPVEPAENILAPTPLATPKPLHVAEHASDDSTPPDFDYSPYINPLLSIEVQLEDVLEENYRDQAEDFVHQNSRASSVRSASIPGGSNCSNGSSSIRSISRSSVQGGQPLFYTPTRPSRAGESLAERLTGVRTPSIAQTPRSLSTTQLSRTPSKDYFEPYHSRSVGTNGGPRTPGTPVPASPFSTHGDRIRKLLDDGPYIYVPKTSRTRGTRSPTTPYHYPSIDLKTKPRDLIFYFREEEKEAIAALVHKKQPNCEKHIYCTDCLNIEFAYYEYKVMPSDITPEARNKIISNNRALRNIKNVRKDIMQNLDHKGLNISDSVSDSTISRGRIKYTNAYCSHFLRN